MEELSLCGLMSESVGDSSRYTERTKESGRSEERRLERTGRCLEDEVVSLRRWEELSC